MADPPQNLELWTSRNGLTVTLDAGAGGIWFEWHEGEAERIVETGILRPLPWTPFVNFRTFEWAVGPDGIGERDSCGIHPSSVSAMIRRLRQRRSVDTGRMAVGIAAERTPGREQAIEWLPVSAPPGDERWRWLGRLVGGYAQLLAADGEPKGSVDRRGQKAIRTIAETLIGPPERPAEASADRRPGQDGAAPTRRPNGRPAASAAPIPAPARPPPTRLPIPPIPLRIDIPNFALRGTASPLSDLRSYSLAERAALWWVSNQSDDLLCWPNCRIERLEYQWRTALRVLGPLRGRALLCDEVGLGKTIEAGLVLKELLTRGMVRRFLVLTTPSLVDQWAEELREKFGLDPVTTNGPEIRSDAGAFWRDGRGIVASLHTLKQAAHVQIAKDVHWDLLIVDEAHHLRNRLSAAWQAVHALPRQYLLLLTATPVQNSIEELYNLVTLIEPGRLPSPKEFRKRFIDPKNPRGPREPAELRRLLGQVMIRNTRSNAGLNLPPRRAETVLFDAAAEEAAFRSRWETEFRGQLEKLSPAQASLWGRLLLQAIGSSPAAWLSALESFPDTVAVGTWRDQAPLEESWRRKCSLLVPFALQDGGVVVFTQFRATQSAVVEYLRAAGIPAFFVNGSTPAAERHAVAERFRHSGGALILTQGGAEGRNLQFCHRLANFDLPWNPMAIEQRIGRLHRLGQTRPVEIYNFVQAGTLQEHLLRVLQEKLNLFELVVGETGLVLGERFGSEEFAEEVLRRWRSAQDDPGKAIEDFGIELAEARSRYSEVKRLDETLFSRDYEL